MYLYTSLYDIYFLYSVVNVRWSTTDLGNKKSITASQDVIHTMLSAVFMTILESSLRPVVSAGKTKVLADSLNIISQEFMYVNCF